MTLFLKILSAKIGLVVRTKMLKVLFKNIYILVSIVTFCNVNSMRDPRKVDAQEWLNTTYIGRGGFTPVKVDGLAGTSLSGAFVKALQIEIGLEALGITEATSSFGPTTTRLCPTLTEGNVDTTNNFVRLLQHALFCKGYHPGGVTGEFREGTAKAVRQLKADAFGEDISDSSVSAMWLKAALNSDAYVCVCRGNPNIEPCSSI